VNLYVLHLFIGRIRVLHFSFHLTFPTLHSCMLPQLQNWLKNKHRAHVQALTWFHTDPIKSTIGLSRIKAWNSSHLFKRRLNFWWRRFFVRIYSSLPKSHLDSFLCQPDPHLWLKKTCDVLRFTVSGSNKKSLDMVSFFILTVFAWLLDKRILVKWFLKWNSMLMYYGTELSTLALQYQAH